MRTMMLLHACISRSDISRHGMAVLMTKAKTIKVRLHCCSDRTEHAVNAHSAHHNKALLGARKAADRKHFSSAHISSSVNAYLGLVRTAMLAGSFSAGLPAPANIMVSCRLCLSCSCVFCILGCAAANNALLVVWSADMFKVTCRLACSRPLSQGMPTATFDVLHQSTILLLFRARCMQLSCRQDASVVYEA